MGFAGGAIGSQQMGIDSPDGTLKNLGARIEAAHSTNARLHYNRLRPLTQIAPPLQGMKSHQLCPCRNGSVFRMARCSSHQQSRQSARSGQPPAPQEFPESGRRFQRQSFRLLIRSSSLDPGPLAQRLLAAPIAEYLHQL